MLKIRLYKNCVLNGNYNYVFSLGTRTGQTKNVLEEYLAGLTYHDIEIPYAYYTNEGKLNIEFQIGQDTIYDYNYMKIVETDENETTTRLTRYCFIDSIVIKNSVCIISYSEDIWHSYSDKITGMKKSFWSNSRIINLENKMITLRNLPVPYDGNKGIYLDFDSVNKYNQFYLLVTIQYYNTSNYGESTKRNYRTFLVNRLDRMGRKSSISDTLSISSLRSCRNNMTLNEIYQAVIYLTQSQSRNSFRIPKETFGSLTLGDVDFALQRDDYYMEIDHFTILPYNSILDTKFDEVYYDSETGEGLKNITVIDFEQIEVSEEDIPIVVYPLCKPIYVPYIPDVSEEIDVRKEIITFMSGTISNPSFKILSLGTLSTQIPMTINGTTISYNILVNLSNDNCFIYLNAGGELTDITKDFTYEPPFNVVSGEENALRRMNRNLSIISSIFSLGTNLIGGGLNIASGLDINNGINEKINSIRYMRTGGYNNIRKKKLEQMQRLNERKSENSFDIISGLFPNSEKMGNNILDIIKTNAPFYSISKGSFLNSDAILNALFGIKVMQINSANDEYVKKAVKNSGFIIYEIIDNLSDLELNKPSYFISNNYNYNTIKFSLADVYGSFPSDIAEQLNEILETGTKVWFNPNLQEDTNDF